MRFTRSEVPRLEVFYVHLEVSEILFSWLSLGNALWRHYLMDIYDSLDCLGVKAMFMNGVMGDAHHILVPDLPRFRWRFQNFLFSSGKNFLENLPKLYFMIELFAHTHPVHIHFI